MRARQLAEIAKLPSGEEAAARAEFDERDKLFTAMRELPEGERRGKMEEFFNKPEIQDKMEERRTGSEERKTPEQRLQRYEKYVQKKQQIKGAAKQ